jgi:hypothetical protein
MQGPAYSRTFRLLATLLVFGACAWLAMLWYAGKLQLSSSLGLWFLAAAAMMLYTWFCIVSGVTTLDEAQLQQTWMWSRKMELRDLAYARVIRVRGLEWLIAPRIYLRTLTGKFAVFYAADAAMVREFERLAAELAAFREMR